METGSSFPLKQIFFAALDVAPDKLPAFLADACGGDTALVAEIMALLRAHLSTVHFFDPNVALAPTGNSVDMNRNRFEWMLLESGLEMNGK